MYGFALAVILPKSLERCTDLSSLYCHGNAKPFSTQQKQSLWKKSGLVYKCDKVNQQTWKMMFTLSFTTSYSVFLLEAEIKLFQDNWITR